MLRMGDLSFLALCDFNELCVAKITRATIASRASTGTAVDRSFLISAIRTSSTGGCFDLLVKMMPRLADCPPRHPTSVAMAEAAMQPGWDVVQSCRSRGVRSWPARRTRGLVGDGDARVVWSSSTRQDAPLRHRVGCPRAAAHYRASDLVQLTRSGHRPHSRNETLWNVLA